MIVTKVYLENFRGYKSRIMMNFDQLTTFIGKNDAGKSTILEALDIFFNDGKNLIKIDKNDINVNSDSDETIIGVCFKNYPQDIILDSRVQTSLKEEFLLNEEDELEVLKKYKNGKLIETYLIANYPTNSEVSELHSKNITQLKKILDNFGLDVEDKRVSSIIRKKILSSLNNPSFEKTMIPVSKEGGKEIWSSLKNYLPLYELFQADRKNLDQDGEIQNPMKTLIKELVKSPEISTKLNDIFNDILSQSEELANETIKKLHEINPDIASELSPNFSNPSWESVFKFSLDSDEGVPVNKRGSGVRRLILLSFFSAQAERRRYETNIPNIIYAIEEPETALHPNHQKMLIQSFLELVEKDINQVILTTHSPSIAKLLPINSLRLLDKNDNGDKVIYDVNSKQEILNEIATSLGVFPDFKLNKMNQVKLAICVEGKNDITFLKKINNNISELRQIMNLNDESIIIIPMGGSTLQFWVNDNYLEKLNVAQLHIYDSDIGSLVSNKYKKHIDVINKRKKSKGFETNLREFENYITPSVILEHYPDLEDILKNLDWKTVDVGELLAKHIYESDPNSKGVWEDLKLDKQKNKKSNAKNRINNDLVNSLTKEHLIQHNYYQEIEKWFHTGVELLKFVE